MNPMGGTVLTKMVMPFLEKSLSSTPAAKSMIVISRTQDEEVPN
jgi:hypothetical protein